MLKGSLYLLVAFVVSLLIQFLFHLLNVNTIIGFGVSSLFVFPIVWEAVGAFLES